MQLYTCSTVSNNVQWEFVKVFENGLKSISCPVCIFKFHRSSPNFPGETVN